MAAERPPRTASRPGRLMALSAAAGFAAGGVAQLLALGGGSVRPVGTGLAPWLTVGFIVTIVAARRLTGPQRLPWTCIVAAAYLYAWLFAYHLLYRVVQSPPTATVWAESRLWVAAVAPGCVALGCLAVGSLRSGVVGDACAAASLAWSLPEAVAAMHDGTSHGLAFALPVLLLAVVPPAVARGRRCDPAIVACAGLLGGAALALALPPLLRVLNHVG